MKIWLDDERKPPSDEWTWCKGALEVVAYLTMQEEHSQIEIMSLDHDLGLGHFEGYYVLEWLERELVIHGFARVSHLPELRVHSANPPAAARMERAIEAIQRIAVADNG